MMGVMDVIAERLKGLREEKGYSQEGMAKIGKMTQSAWAGWERRAPNALWSLVALARHFDVSSDYLLQLTDISEPTIPNTLPEGGSVVLKYLAGLSGPALTGGLFVLQ